MRAQSITHICQTCGNPFLVQSARLRQGLGKYCDQDCYVVARRSPDRCFWSKVKKTDGCWVWQARLNHNGYGRLKVRSKDMLAHRFSYELAYGPIPDSLSVCHHCDNPPCVRPSHLFLGTHMDNMLDAFNKGRMVDPPLSFGETHYMAHLTEADVRTIRQEADGKYGTLTRLARQYGVTKQAIRAVVLRQTWAHVP